ncbi:thioesterase family protein [Parasegetibacter sp. NRK P23]|uniref:acyl-CoA thioesterase n=1 Tax=Parasegetibacter sp. NRK P23 TaxID=2942999 RepID=UPI002042ECA2|nr:thioesterase family protein [Parasegetibacter sp. NRK P23]MCM5529281.1 thioesterase family protein [Parasegetibacter sp. NRK P23]
MARIKIELPANFTFSTTIPVRITDVNYGGHVGNDSILSMLHEARMRFLKHLGYSELSLEGVSLIMADVAIEFKAELFYGEEVIASVAATEFSKVGFELYYKLEKEVEGARKLVATAKTGMICFNYDTRKVAAVPALAAEKLQA